MNSVIKALASEFNAKYVNTNSAFVGKEAALTYLGQYPAGSMSPGVDPDIEPLGDIHPNSDGYAVIANQITATPEPGNIGLAGFVTVAVGLVWRRRRQQV